MEKSRGTKQIAVGLVALVALATAAVVSPVDAWVIASAGWIEEAGALGALVFGLLYFAGTIFFIPATIMSISAGFLFGFAGGITLVSICTTLGAVVAFAISRYVARDAVQARAETRPRFKALERAISREGFKMAFLTRLVPVLPFTVLNYLFGLTRVDGRRFTAATWLGMLPTSIAYVYVGAATGDLSRALAMEEAPGGPTYLLWGLSAVAIAAIVGLMTRRARRELDLIMDED